MGNSPVKEHSKRKHAKFAPSASKRWRKCPGSVKLSETAPPQEDSPYAKEGTDAHECLEYLMRRVGNLEKAAKFATLVKNKDGERKWNDEMIEHGVKSAKSIMELKPSKTAKLLIETRSQMSKEVYGSLDYAWVDEWGLLVVIDYKYGAGVPVLPYDEEEDEENPQLMCYAAGIAKKYRYEFDAVKLVVIQPRVWKDDEDPVSEHTTSIKRLKDFEKSSAEAVKAAMAPNAKIYAGDGDHCRWCPAAASCPELSKVQMNEAGIGFDFEGEEVEMPEVSALPLSNLGNILRACDKLEVWIEKVRALAFQKACKGEEISGFKLVNKKSIRTWLPGSEHFAEALYGDEIYKRKLLSPAQLEEKFGKEAKFFTEEFTSNESSGYTLVKNSDKRKPVEITHGFDVEEV